ncbi:hypothetical protein [Mesotoga sp.]|uniref:hypothetical protein n=1 Tax=Mesotoga sp. TaxID=2053577 RepID=UPI00345E3819
MPGEASGDARLPSAGSEARKNIRGSDAAKSIAGSEARWREEVMPGGTSGEVMRRKITGGRKAAFGRRRF